MEGFALTYYYFFSFQSSVFITAKGGIRTLKIKQQRIP